MNVLPIVCIQAMFRPVAITRVFRLPGTGVTDGRNYHIMLTLGTKIWVLCKSGKRP